LAFHRAGNNIFSIYQVLPKARLYKASICRLRVSSPMPIAVLQEQEVPSKAWALFPKRNTAEFGLNPEGIYMNE
jgi:hypothetical protein